MKNLLRYILLCIGVLLGNNVAQAKDYVKEIILNNPPYVVEWENVYSWMFSDGNRGDTRIGLKNGGELLVKVRDPEFAFADEGDTGGFWVEEENAFKVENAGFIILRYRTLQNDACIMAGDVNYFGVLQYQGSDAPEEIIVTKENEHELVGVPDGVFEAIWWTCDNTEADFSTPYDNPRCSFTLAELLNFGTEFSVEFDDGTSNRGTDGNGTISYGTSYAKVRLIDKRNEASDYPYTVTAKASPAEGGTIEGAGTYKRGEVATLTAKPAPGWKFDVWKDGVYGDNGQLWGGIAGYEPVLTYTPSADEWQAQASPTHEFVALFVQEQYVVTLSTIGSGEAYIVGHYSGETYTYGTEIKLYTLEDDGWEFDCWQDAAGNVLSTETPWKTTVTGNMTLKAKFRRNVPTGIDSAAATDGKSGATDGKTGGRAVNLMGVSVGEGYKGIVVRDGRKVIMK